MSFGPPPTKKVTQSKATASGSTSQSGRSSPIIISCSTSVALPQTMATGHIKDPAQTTTRSISSSHLMSHARTNNLPTPQRAAMPTSSRQASPGRSGLYLHPEETHRECQEPSRLNQHKSQQRQLPTRSQGVEAVLTQGQGWWRGEHRQLVPGQVTECGKEGCIELSKDRQACYLGLPTTNWFVYILPSLCNRV